MEVPEEPYALEWSLAGEGETVPAGTVVGRLLASGVEPVEHAEVRASPAARRLARQLGVDLAKVGTGRRLRESDVRAFHAAQTPSVEAARPENTPLVGRRRVIAERMRSSLLDRHSSPPLHSKSI